MSQATATAQIRTAIQEVCDSLSITLQHENVFSKPDGVYARLTINRGLKIRRTNGAPSNNRSDTVGSWYLLLFTPPGSGTPKTDVLLDALNTKFANRVIADIRFLGVEHMTIGSDEGKQKNNETKDWVDQFSCESRFSTYS